jgi:hypothetical protein
MDMDAEKQNTTAFSNRVQPENVNSPQIQRWGLKKVP